jgi:hypothetical protein
MVTLAVSFMETYTITETWLRVKDNRVYFSFAK